MEERKTSINGLQFLISLLRMLFILSELSPCCCLIRSLSSISFIEKQKQKLKNNCKGKKRGENGGREFFSSFFSFRI